MKRLISFVLVGLLAACHEPITEPPSPNFAARGCEPGPSHHGRGSNPCRLLALLAPVYSVLHNTQDNYYNVSEISTDEMIVPTRGQDWYDGGTWLDLHRQTWTATSPATLTFLNGVWNDAFSGIPRANELLDALRNARGRDQAIIAAEARTLRAFYYYQLTDMFGGVPIFTTPQFAPQPRNTRAELFRFIETELLEARTALPNNWVAADYERMTKGAADAILASMYLNAAEALALLNALRARVFEPDKPLTTVDRDVILRERLLELTAEAKRRQDLIRHGRYTQAWSFKQAGGPHLILMPIPQSQLDANPMLVQNPGY